MARLFFAVQSQEQHALRTAESRGLQGAPYRERASPVAMLHGIFGDCAEEHPGRYLDLSIDRDD